jgi:hypothetical protein
MTNQQAYETVREAVQWVADPVRRNAAEMALNRLAEWINDINMQLKAARENEGRSQLEGQSHS